VSNVNLWAGHNSYYRTHREDTTVKRETKKTGYWSKELEKDTAT